MVLFWITLFNILGGMGGKIIIFALAMQLIA